MMFSTYDVFDAKYVFCSSSNGNLSTSCINLSLFEELKKKSQTRVFQQHKITIYD